MILVIKYYNMGNGNNRQQPARNRIEVRANRPPGRPSENMIRQQQHMSRVINNQPSYNAPPRNVPTQTVSASKKYEILAHINKQSISASPSLQNPGRTYINFQYDAKEECTITLYYFGIEVLDSAYSTQ